MTDDAGASELYDLEAVELPRLSGVGLTLFAAALELPLIGPPVIAKLAKDAGVDKLAEWTGDEAPRPTSLSPRRLADPAREDPSVDLSMLEGLVGDAAAESTFTSAKQLTDAFRAGETTPLEVARRVLDGVRARASLSLFIAQLEDDVYRMAEASTERWAQGAPIGPLDGVPVGIKDEVDMVPYPTTVGTTFLGSSPAREDATTVLRLREAGAVLLGKCNLHEIGINPNGANAHYGVVRNPYRPTHDSGGSSSASAASVAVGACPLALGADGGGSIRIPAALSGVVGLKPTFGRVSEHGAAPLAWTVGHLGPIGATVYDAALGYAVMAGPDPKDPASLVQPALSLEGSTGPDLSGVRVGVYREWFEHAQPAMVEASERANQSLVDAGASLVDIVIPDLDVTRIAHAVTILCEMATSMDRHIEHHRKLAPHVRVNLQVGRSFSARDYVRAQRVRARAMSNLDRVFDRVDVIATPTTACTAPEIPVRDAKGAWSDLSTVTELMRFIFIQNLTGHPAISVPAGYDDDGLPIGFQLTARHWEESLLFRLARVVERNVERRRPDDYISALG